MFYSLLEKCQPLAKGKKKFRFKNKLLSLDASIIELCSTLFDWARSRETKGAVKLHLLLDHEGYLPVFALITEGAVHEVNVIRDLSFPKGSILAIDQGYTDYSLFAQWTDTGVYFVTRQKDNASYRVIEEKTVPTNRHILKDEVICFIGYYARTSCPHPLRRIEVDDVENNRVIVLLTNHLEFGATTIARIDRDRWQIKTFFKTLKQNLKIKTLVGTSQNALFIQIWTALITILLLKYFQFQSTLSWPFSTLVALLRYHLFTYRDRWLWINHPFEVPVIASEE